MCLRDMIEYAFMAIVAYVFKNKNTAFIVLIFKKIKSSAPFNNKWMQINKSNKRSNPQSTIIKFIDGSKIMNTKISDEKTCNLMNSGITQEPLSHPSILLSCKTCKDCKTRHCPCRREGVSCNSLCHNGGSCQNKKCNNIFKKSL